MKYFWIGFITMILIALAIGCSNAYADDHDDRYVGIHITIPFSLDGVGTQILARYDDTEYRLGYDSNRNWQIGAGFGVGEEVVYSAGMAYSSYQGTGVPYIGVRSDIDNDYEYGVVSYGLNQPTTYIFAGLRVNDDGEESNSNSSSSSSGNDTDGGDNGGGDSDPGDGSNGGDSGDGGSPGDGDDGGSDDDTNYANNHSGLGDGTNPGKGRGRTNSPNTGTSNPSSANR